MPVHRCAVARLVHDRHRDGLPALEHDGWSRNDDGIRGALGAGAAEHERVGGVLTVNAVFLANDEPDRARVCRCGRNGETCARVNAQADHQSVHLVRRIRRVVRVVLRRRDSLVGVHRDEMREMSGKVTVEDPVTCAVGEKTHSHRLPRIDDLRHRHATQPRREQCVAVAVSLCVDAEVEAVQMHRVVERREVDHAPVHGVVLHEVELFRVRP